MRRFIILSALLALAPGCHRQSAQRVQPKAPDSRPIALDPSPPMKASDIDAIASEVSRKSKGVHAASAPHPSDRAGTAPSSSAATQVRK